MHSGPLIFDISMGRLEDGEGIRTVVFCKGCPLRCQWCHNPESHSFSHDFLWDGGKCLGCKGCERACPKGLITIDGAEFHLAKESLEVELPNTDRCNIAGKASDMHVEESLEVELPNTDWCNIAGKASDIHAEESLDVAHPLPISAISQARPVIGGDKESCDACGKCSDACPSNALRLVGRRYSVEELVEILLRDRHFYQASGGGVTFSGGEPLAFPEYVGEVAKRLKAEGISVAVETSGYFAYEVFRERVLPYVDCVLYDLKLMNEQEHIRYTGVSNRRILDNFRRLAGEQPGVKLIPRTPVIPGITDGNGNQQEIERFLTGFTKVFGHVLLPYNRDGERKRKMLRELS